jgi:hypothetical protein
MSIGLGDLAILGAGLATAAGGVWTLWQYVIARAGKPHPVAKITCRILDHVDRDGSRIADIRLMAKNTGGARLVIKSIFVSVRGLDKNAKITNDGPLKQAYFPISIASKRRMFPDSWGHSFVEPNQTVSYKHLTKIPAGVKVIHIHGKLECPDPSIEFITASETVEI